MSRNADGLTPRRERFCRAFVEQGGAASAARIAGYAAASVRNQGYRLLKEPCIRARIAAIQSEMAQQAGREADVLIGKLENLYRRAVESAEFATAARIVEAQARLAGVGAGRSASRSAKTTESSSPEAASAETSYAETNETSYAKADETQGATADEGRQLTTKDDTHSRKSAGFRVKSRG